MPRVKTMKFQIDGKEYVSHVNFSAKSGMFSTSVHWQVLKTIGFSYEGKKMLSSTLDGITAPINEAYAKYIDSQKTHKLFISIDYKCSGAFMFRSDGHCLFDFWKSPFKYDKAYWELSVLQFGFKIYCMQTDSNGIEVWYNVALNKEDDTVLPWTVFVGDNNEFHLDGIKHHVDGVLIPYTEEAYSTLMKAQEGIRKVSETLVNFLSQDEKEISSLLNSGRLLGLNEAN